MLFLLISALSIGFVHTLLGPDHYVPFIVLAKSRDWSMAKTAIITSLCGIGHVLSAAVLGLLAVAFGFALNKLDFIESLRGEVAAWLLIGFGFAYLVWGLKNIFRGKIQGHSHIYADGLDYIRNDSHDDIRKGQVIKKSLKEIVPWILFIIFVFGPCEPLIPLIMYPASQKSILGTVWVILSFSLGTLFTMLSIVLLTVYGTNKLPQFSSLKRYSNVLAGAVISGCGLAIKFLGI